LLPRLALGPADDLLAGAAEQPFGGRVPAQHDAIAGRTDDGIVRVLDDRRQPVQQATIFFCHMVVGHVVHRRDHQLVILGLRGGQVAFPRERAAIPSPAVLPLSGLP